MRHARPPMLAAVRWLAVCLAALYFVGCDSARGRPSLEPTDTASPFASQCSACHGMGDDPAPPRALDGATSTQHRAIGAHQLHLRPSAISLPVQCSACHAVPSNIFDAGHLDSEVLTRAEVRFRGRARANGANPTWDAEKLTCSGTWCHGAVARYGGRFMAPKWNRVDGSQRACDACHGAPPPPPHPQLKACEGCHADVVGVGRAGGGRIILDRSRHIDGRVDVRLSDQPPCAGCHGDPPTENHPKLTACVLCHGTSVGPNRVLIPGGTHRDGVVDFALPGGDCTACHGAPPTTNNHPHMRRCGPCHAETMNDLGPSDGPSGGPSSGLGSLRVDGAHLNGVIDAKVPTACNACHGGAKTGPPPDHNGETSPTSPGVGAHQAHLKVKGAGGVSMTCATCHDLPMSVTVTGHLLGSLQSVTFPGGDDLAHHKGSTPAYDPKTQRCSGVYCHGSTMDGAGQPSPRWTDVGYDCDACHGNPPPPISGHPQLKAGQDTKACHTCHAKTVDKTGKLRTDTDAHINGWVDP